MTETAAPKEAAPFLDRIGAVRDRLGRSASLPPGGGLTAPDPPTGERWDWGQVWAHVAEFVPYWQGQIRLILSVVPERDPVPFGRTKSDTERVVAIERDRRVSPAHLYERVLGHLQELRRFLGWLSEADWSRRGEHSTLGVMAMPEIVEEFLVGHLEDHAAQLEGLAGDG